MFRAVIGSTLAIALSAVLLWAHGTATHVMGTVSAVDGAHVTVNTVEGKSTMVMLDKTTKYFNGSKGAAKPADLKVGIRVVIDARMDTKMKMLKAEEVRIGVSTPVKGQK